MVASNGSSPAQSAKVRALNYEKGDWNPNSNIVKLGDEVWIEVPADQIGQPIPGEAANGYLNGGYQLYSDDHGRTWSIRNTSNTDYWSA